MGISWKQRQQCVRTWHAPTKEASYFHKWLLEGTFSLYVGGSHSSVSVCAFSARFAQIYKPQMMCVINSEAKLLHWTRVPDRWDFTSLALLDGQAPLGNNAGRDVYPLYIFDLDTIPTVSPPSIMWGKCGSKWCNKAFTSHLKMNGCLCLDSTFLHWATIHWIPVCSDQNELQNAQGLKTLQSFSNDWFQEIAAPITLSPSFLPVMGLFIFLSYTINSITIIQQL